MFPRLIVFLDQDNRLLSPTAEVLFRSILEGTVIKGITLVSAGAAHQGFVTRDSGMDGFLKAYNLSISGIVNPVSEGLVDYADWIVCMDDESRNCRQLQKPYSPQKHVLDFPTKRTLTKLLKESSSDYARIYEEIEKGCQALLAKIKE
jgi:protein-tyrosine-phosphatase